MMEIKTEELVKSLSYIGIMASAHADAASHIAHARWALFKAYRDEGFTEHQALDLCKALTL
jgi:hypothetical protein